MIKKMKSYEVMIKEDKETPVYVKANTEERASRMAQLLFLQRPDDPRVLHGQVDCWTTEVTNVREVNE